jgi:hypothetical protein
MITLLNTLPRPIGFLLLSALWTTALHWVLTWTGGSFHW